ncbi:hypothetical protein BU23DRAFT_568057 [Bimuria novae-zelandiae CBS 107.79]|uniref:SWI/SNF family DNA-dependent ATPase Ris1 n=1 Tax=Bimuria novae-zelandiae CBS 107.79 TaxID=1447943 RepID=A0A6A5VF51_9PLEO|nr:hypothetical protein BU23DRAFT_568057 [Bimuria novae-zelandiae CBS 107.79]
MAAELYVPAHNLSDPIAIRSEVDFLCALMNSMDEPAINPHYAQQRAHYEGHINRLTDQLAQPSPAGPSPAASSAAVTPGSAADWNEVSRKRPREFSFSDNEQLRAFGNSAPESPGTPFSFENMPGAYPGPKRPRQNGLVISGSNIVDLTGDDPVPQEPSPQLPLRSQNPGYNNPVPAEPFPADPFPEMFHERQPVLAQSHPADAFVQEPIGLDELAQFMSTATTIGGGYGYNQLLPGQQNPFLPPQPLDLEHMGGAPWQGSRDLAIRLPALSVPSTADSQVIDSIIKNIKSQDDAGMPREPTPKGMSCKLMEHQKQGLAWLLNMERGENKGGILADEMGLGKTIEGLALIVANPSKNPARKTTLIVAPVALMRQWEKEIERHIKPSERLSIYTYHRNGKKADWSVLREYDIVMTTYGTLANEQKRIDTRKESAANDRERRDDTFKRKSKDKLGLLDPNCYWYRVILDEAQCIKNRSTLTSKAASALSAEYRLCMTGTPMQNSIEELYPLIRFLHITAYQAWPKFNDDFVKPIKSNSEYSRKRGMARLQALIKSVMLRREKTTIVDGQPIVNLPPKHVASRHVKFSAAEHELYKAVETKSQLKFNAYLKKGTVSNHYANILVMLLRLRQLCCHPHLVNDLGVQVSTDGIKEEDLKSRAQSLTDDVVNRLEAFEDDDFQCPICFEMELNPTIIIPCGHHCCGECFQRLVDPARAVQDGNESGSATCPSCRGTLSSERITDYRHFCKVFCPNKYEEVRQKLTGTGIILEEEAEEGQDETGSESGNSSDDDDDEDANDATLGGFIVDEDADDDDEMDDAEASGVFSGNGGKTMGKGKGKAKVKAKEVKKKSFAELKKLSHRSIADRKAFFKRLKKNFKTSAKIDETMRLLDDIRENDPTEKTLIFSSFTALLDLLEIPLSEKYKYVRYDGSMKFDDRIEAVNDFMDKADENIMLISIKAGNAGLNLNKASQVIMLDPFWNPFVEDQAVDRAHRMPQQREVHVHRVLVPDTVEDRICKLQDKKREIINAALDDGAGKSLSKLSVNELRSLFFSM